MVQNCIILYEWEIQGVMQEMKSKMSIDWGPKEYKKVFIKLLKVRSQVSNYIKSNIYELIDPFCLIIALNCDSLPVGLLPTINPGGRLQQIGEIDK